MSTREWESVPCVREGETEREKQSEQEGVSVCDVCAHACDRERKREQERERERESVREISRSTFLVRIIKLLQSVVICFCF